jgi:hypothetical protein
MVPTATSPTPDSPLAVSEIAERLPPGAWFLELAYAGLRFHETAIRERSASNPDFDPNLPRLMVEAARDYVERWLSKVESSPRNRELILAYWERGLQADLHPALEAKLARTITDDENGRKFLLLVLTAYLPDPNYRSAAGVSFFGAPALFLRIAQQAGIDHLKLLEEASDTARKVL